MENKYSLTMQHPKNEEVTKKDLGIKSAEHTADNKLTLEEEFTETLNKYYSRMPARATKKIGFSRSY